MQGRSIRLAKIFGIDIRLDFSWVIIFVLVTWTFSYGYFPVLTPELGRNTNFLLGLFSSVIFFASVITHELAHSVVAKRNGLPVKLITLFIFGGASHIEDEPETPWVEFKMAFVGPLSSLVLGGVFYLIGYALTPFTGLFVMFQLLAIINIILGIFNLLPGFPLDGGRILRAIIWFYNKNFLEATKYAVYGGYIISFGLATWGAIDILNNLIIGGVWLIVIASFLYSLAGASYRQAESKVKLSNVQVKDIIDDNFIIVDPTTKLDKIFQMFFKQNTDTIFTGFNKKVSGYITLSDIEKVGNGELNKEVSKFTHSLNQEEILKPSDDAFKAAKSMQKEDLSCVPVEEGDRIRGIVCKSQIFAILKSR